MLYSMTRRLVWDKIHVFVSMRHFFLSMCALSIATRTIAFRSYHRSGRYEFVVVVAIALLIHAAKKYGGLSLPILFHPLFFLVTAHVKFAFFGKGGGESKSTSG